LTKAADDDLGDMLILNGSMTLESDGPGMKYEEV
jgi:hypothetical protein